MQIKRVRSQHHTTHLVTFIVNEYYCLVTTAATSHAMTSTTVETKSIYLALCDMDLSSLPLLKVLHQPIIYFIHEITTSARDLVIGNVTVFYDKNKISDTATLVIIN